MEGADAVKILVAAGINLDELPENGIALRVLLTSENGTIQKLS